MANMSDKEQNFINAVFKKAEYLKYLRNQDNIVKENYRQIKKRSLLLMVCSLPFLIVIFFIIKITNMNIGAMLILCVFALTIGSYYEFMEENSKYETNNK